MSKIIKNNKLSSIECPICFNNYKKKEMQKFNPCSHSCCKSCYEQLIKKTNTNNTINCFYCRTECKIKKNKVEEKQILTSEYLLQSIREISNMEGIDEDFQQRILNTISPLYKTHFSLNNYEHINNIEYNELY